MKVLKKFWLALLALVPASAGAVAPFIVGGAIGLGASALGIIGVSIWRSNSPVDMQQALEFFSSCWTCQIFSDVMVSLSLLLPGVYKALGQVVLPMTIALLALLVAWNFFSNTINNKMDAGSKIMGNFMSYVFKVSLLAILLLIPLPRLITNALIEPAFVIGSSFDYIISDNNTFSECMVATAIADPVSISQDAANYGAFSPKLRHQLVCEIANVHQITGLGMAVGWTMMNMAFDSDYMHKIFYALPIFPNVPIFLVGLLILGLFFYALLPIPLFFLEVFVTLSMDLIMLPLMLMSWVFDDENFKILPKGGRTIREMIDDVIKAVVGIALTVVFLTFSVMFFNAAFGTWAGAGVLEQAIMRNDSKFFMDALYFKNDSLVTIVLMGIFIAMFMTMIPQLSNMLFKVKISDAYYETAKKDIQNAWETLKKWGSAIKN